MPSMLLCGGFQRIVQNVILWFSSGGTKSVLHNDGLDNVNCVIDGEKYFVMIDKVHNSITTDQYACSNCLDKILDFDVDGITFAGHHGAADNQVGPGLNLAEGSLPQAFTLAAHVGSGQGKQKDKESAGHQPIAALAPPPAQSR